MDLSSAHKRTFEGVRDGKRSKQAETRDKEKESREGCCMMTHEEIIAKLKSLEDDLTMTTKDSYTPNAVDWPTGRIPFVDHHLAYLRTHKTVNPSEYISNLELMIKKR